MKIDGIEISRNHPPYIIAEISANHNGAIAKALKLIELAKECGADAVKIQTYTADTMTVDSQRSDFKIEGGPWDGYTLYQLYREAHTPWEWHKNLFEKAGEVGITFFSSPFDETAVDFLADLNVPAFKVASFELKDLILIEYMAKQMKPMIVSSGMANTNEIEEALAIIRKYHNNIILLHCVSGYPTPLEQSNLSTVSDLEGRFKVIPGLSDHTLGTAAAVASVALGACVIEKHFIESRKDKGPDSDFSLEPSELRTLCFETKSIWKSLQGEKYEMKEAESPNLKFRRSIYFIKSLKAGDVIAEDSIKRIRPGFGLEPKYFNEIIGKKVKRNIEENSPVKWDDINWDNQ